MKRTFTSHFFVSANNLAECRKSRKQRMSPKKQTLDFLMQFARSYHVEAGLPEELSGIVLN